MIHPTTEIRFIKDKVGHVVVPTAFILKEPIIWVLNQFDREFTTQ
ncbi:hypothetical protein [Patiriisocius sp. Uisw_017]|jgi:hypothetical protein